MITFWNIVYGGNIILGVLPATFSWRFQKDDRILSEIKRADLESKVQELALKLGITKPVELIEKKGLFDGLQAQGTTFFSGRAGIALDPEFTVKLTDGELEFCIAHELSHIKANDLIWVGVVPCIVGMITTLAISILFPSTIAFSSIVATLILPPAGVLGSLVSMIAFAIFSQWRESAADKLGWSICSKNAQKAAPELFEKIRNAQLDYRNSVDSLWRKFLITEDGDFRLDGLHPPLKNRIKSLRQLQS